MQKMVEHIVQYFNPRSHKGSDQDITAANAAIAISTHAPTKGATSERGSGSSNTSDFNPRSHKGSDRQADENIKAANDFNPRSHKGSDPSGVRACGVDYISTHAPTKGAT